MSHHNSDRHSPARPTPVHSQQPTENKPRGNSLGNFHRLSAPLDENADRLMDEVFGEIERLLERGAQLEASPVPEPAAQLSSVIEFSNSGGLTTQPDASPAACSSLALLPKLSPRQLTREENQETAENLDDQDVHFILKSAPKSASEEKSQSESKQSASLWLMGLAFVSLVMASALWFFVRYYLPKVPATVPSAAEVLQDKQDGEFLTYVQRAMERIDRASKQAEAETPVKPGSLPSVLPPLYVPLPPPPSTATVPAASPAVVPSPTARISVAPLPPITTVPATVPSSPAVSAPGTAGAIPNIVPSPTHVLLGLLELGDRSAALFEISGAPQRIQVGEAIGSSGWALVSVSGEAAIVRRNGEVRSIYIGQKF